MRRLAAAVAPLALATGCFHVHLERNAPGHVDDLASPPEERVETPRDPGERFLVLAAGPLLGAGVETGPGGGAALRRGGAASLRFGESPLSHADHFFPALPTDAPGLNAGADLLALDHDLGVGTAWAELEARDDAVFALGAGWRFPLWARAHGPQLTASLGPLYLRATYFLDRGAALTVGVALKPWGTFTWSR